MSSAIGTLPDRPAILSRADLEALVQREPKPGSVYLETADATGWPVKCLGQRHK